MPQNPKSKLEKIICDADLYHIATVEYFKKAALLKREWELTQGHKYGKREWLKLNKKFIETHQYFIEYARKNLEEGKPENLEEMNKRLSMKDDRDQIQKLQRQIEKLEAKNKKAKEENPERGMQPMFRITSKNHLELSALADNKANIMISVNSIILSILVTVLYRKLEEYPYMVIPAVILTIVCLITIVLAILATRPIVSLGTFTKDDINNKKTNLLFFGNFHGMELSEYTWAMNELMKDDQYLYNSLIKDIYFLGKVLDKEYKFRRLSYTIFMFGFVISVISLVVTELFLRRLCFKSESQDCPSIRTVA